jgi:hypothetical protein
MPLYAYGHQVIALARQEIDPTRVPHYTRMSYRACGLVHAVFPRPIHLRVARVHALLAQPPLHITHVLPIHAELVVDRLH